MNDFKYTLLLLMLWVPLISCGTTRRYICDDHRATYFDVNGFAIKPRNGIANGFVLIPSLGDAGSVMLGKYAKVENGLIVEYYKGRPPEVQKNFWDPWAKEMREARTRSSTPTASDDGR